jgi:hypothetical protein
MEPVTLAATAIGVALISLHLARRSRKGLPAGWARPCGIGSKAS